MTNVCAHYCGTTILLESFETEEEAREFMKHEYVMYYADEFEDQDEDDVIMPAEMFIEDELPFFETPKTEIELEDLNLDELPF